MKKKHLLSSLALTAAAALTLAGCSAGGDDTAGGDTGGSDEAATQDNVTIAVFNGWDEGVAASFLWKAVLEDNGYTVELEYADPAPVYLGLTTDDYDLTLDTWLPLTHA
ncbi:MAG TPA: glycine betaine ABC transporter substrate-binding protein, partial [Microbacteriaceae bacterium]|nr:glycine betaine ABC transporter substrate-binding protein [Microbacteriaceae bacterium]